jgi:hypothetical protein
MKVDRIAARRVCGVCGEEQTSVGVNCRSVGRGGGKREMSSSRTAGIMQQS